MGNRITGLSGMDIEGMVSSLMKVENQKTNKLYKQKTLLTWKQEAYKNLSTSLKTFSNQYFSFTNPTTNLKSSAFFLLKNFSVKKDGADSSAVTIKNTSLSKNVEHKMTIEKLAKSQKMVSNRTSTGDYTKSIASTEIDFNGLKEGSSITLNLDGQKITASLDSPIVSQIQSASNDSAKLTKLAEYLDGKFGTGDTGTGGFGKGISGNDKVNVEVKNGKLTFETEAGRTLSVSSFSNGYKSSMSFGYDKTNTNDMLSFDVKVGTSTKTVDVKTFRWEDADADDVNAVNGKKKVYLNADELATAISNRLSDSDIGISGLSVKASGSNIKFEATSKTTPFNIKEKTAVPSATDPDKDNLVLNKRGLMESTKDAAGNYTAIDLYGRTASVFGVEAGASTDNASSISVGSAFSLGNTDISGFSITGNGKTVTFGDLNITSDTKLSEMISKINNAGLNIKLSYSAVSGTYTFEGTKTGKDNGFTLSSGAMSMFGFDSTFGADGKLVDDNKAWFTAASDAEFWLDGVHTSRTTNEFSIGDLSVVLNEEDKDNEITIKSTSDTDTMIKNIKEFINSYNKLLTSFSTAYSESRTKNGNYGYYEPLTDEEKAAMSDKDIELWEVEAKKGLLARDGTVGKVVDSLRNVMSARFELGGDKKISLSQIGISSTSWQDMGVLSVDEDKLRKALEERPEDVAALFNREPAEGYYGDRQKRNSQAGIAYLLDDIIQDATRTTPHPKTGNYGYFTELVGSATAKISDSDMALRLKEINQKIYDLELLNMTKESNYYNMFSKMEQAMTKAQNQMSMAGLGQ